MQVPPYYRNYLAGKVRAELEQPRYSFAGTSAKTADMHMMTMDEWAADLRKHATSDMIVSNLFADTNVLPVNDVLDAIIASSTRDYEVEVAKILRNSGALDSKAKVEVHRERSERAQALLSNSASGASGVWLPKHQTALLFPEQGGTRNKIAIHEIVHGATVESLDADTPIAKATQASLERLRLHAIAELQKRGVELPSTTMPDGTIRYGGDYYGLTNIQEFVAETFSKPDLRDILSKIAYEQNKTVWDRLIELFNALLGGNPKSGTALNEAISLGLEAIAEQSRIKGKAWTAESAQQPRYSFASPQDGEYDGDTNKQEGDIDAVFLPVESARYSLALSDIPTATRSLSVSPANPPSIQSVKYLAEKLVNAANNRNVPEIMVYPSAADIPFKTPAGTIALYRRGVIHIAADEITSPIKLNEAIFHEMIGHFGLARVLWE